MLSSRSVVQVKTSVPTNTELLVVEATAADPELAATAANTLATMLAGASAFGETPTPCYEAYLASGLTEQQMSFEEFAEFYGDTLCASEHEPREA